MTGAAVELVVEKSKTLHALALIHLLKLPPVLHLLLLSLFLLHSLS